MSKYDGAVFGALTVLRCYAERNDAGNWVQRADVACACGTSYTTYMQNLVNGGATKCVLCARKSRKLRGYTTHPLYPTWWGMNERCYNPNNASYAGYGARGISVCIAWRKTGTTKDAVKFFNFLEDMQGDYLDGLTLDRIDNDGPYEPSNCRWATRAAQANNTRTNVFVTALGRTLSIAQWALLLKVPEAKIRGPITKYQLPPEYVVETIAADPTRRCRWVYGGHTPKT